MYVKDLQEIVACPGLYRELPETKHHINNKPALINTLDHVHNQLPWIERLDIVTEPAPAAKELDVPNNVDEIDPDDDFKRENYFYRLAQAAVLVAIPKLHQLGVPTKRPSDYFAEMVKSDEHMNKVKQHLVEAQQRLALRERARQMREKRKFGKQTQQAVLQARREDKRKLTEAVKASRKKSGRSSIGLMGSSTSRTLSQLEYSVGKNQEEVLEKILGEYRNEHEKAGFHRPKDIANRRKFNVRRDFKNKKYGHGGQKKRSKRNTMESAGSGAHLRRDFNPLKHQAKPSKAGKMRTKRKMKVTGKSHKGRRK
ncbi:Eukaryotic rRNA processing protein EBP2 [Paragonimus heterotremus]|uniref:Eukaryotic rRNA processing protein EBP2 n=1 Tax=Paragonimus heterotremus TaxID=100268 RepID=A0A8J4SN52_9TREM|nr:Eukaryotic rRNA processing protein EBP2 [Paragonimus heterotremus]